ncbi:hypothetical protein [Streptomyces sp. TLI_146]|uniref:hypothetical protein n=1 Tax=Streptomyces sp. TLI_146 TaxID=1938858 RepID=UPI00117F7A5D|nr:hypothetical protein [Streptomyces sp. TLI_146]
MNPEPVEQQPLDDPAQGPQCEVCDESGADIVTVMVIGEGGEASMHAHRNCTLASAAGAVSG